MMTILLLAFLFKVNESSVNDQANNTAANASLPRIDLFGPTDPDDPFQPTEDPFPPTNDSFFESSGDEYDIDEEENGYFGFSTEEAKEIESQIEEALLAKVSQENDSTLFALGHQFKDFVFECSFRGYDCR